MAKTKKSQVTTKDEIDAIQRGRNIIMVIGGEKYSRAFPEKSDRERLLAEAVAYNKRPTKTRKTAIIKELTAHIKRRQAKEDKIKAIITKSTIDAAKKKAMSIPKAATKKASKAEVTKAKTVKQKSLGHVATASPYRRPGEH